MDDGRHAFQRGDIEGAVSSWQEAVQGYAATQQLQAQIAALMHLAGAYEALGHSDRAEGSLRTALRLAETTSDRTQAPLILGRLAELALATNSLDEAERLVNEAWARARKLDDGGITATILHTRGNLLMIRQQWFDALAAYRHSAKLAQQAQQPGIAARALVYAAMAAERDDQAHTARAFLHEARAHLRQVSPSHDSAYELLLIGHVYHRLAKDTPNLVLQAATAFQASADLAQTLQDQRTLSYAWGYLGQLYEEAQRYQEALTLTRRAALAAQQLQAPESLYLWQWQTGRLLRVLGELQPALDAYGRAVETVQSMHAALLQTQLGIRGPFRETVGSLYFEFAELLLQQASALETSQQQTVPPQYEVYVQRAQDVIEQFKTAELRDYFGDACVAAARPRETALAGVSSDAAVVYPILLPERTELLVSLSDGIKRIVVSVPGPQLERRARFLRNALQDRDPVRYLRHAKHLYRWLIQPLEADIATEAIKTLVFVPDGALRLIPLAALHDGERYLIEKYAVAITPSLTLTDPQPVSRDTLRALAAGMTEAAEGFSPLPLVGEELRAIRNLYGGIVLLDEDFSASQLDTTLRQGRFGIVHIASHGQFATNAAESFLLTTEGRLTLPQLAQIVGRQRFRTQPLELLTLSACETAQGDDRAALGLAGVAIQAGARSALATLWKVSDEATAALMRAFYQHLSKPGVSRAQALQRAQMALLKELRFAEPFFWAPFLLINNWL